MIQRLFLLISKRWLPIAWLLPIGPATFADYPLKPVSFSDVELTSSFWRARLEIQRKTLVPFAFASWGSRWSTCAAGFTFPWGSEWGVRAAPAGRVADLVF